MDHPGPNSPDPEPDTLRVRWVSPWRPVDRAVPGAVFSADLSLDEADALLCDWAPSEELLRFEGPCAWFTAEPRTDPRLGPRAHPVHREFLARLRPDQMFHHAHEDPRFRVPHVTHLEPLDPSSLRVGSERVARAVAVISNYGGAPSNRWRGVRLRNRFATAEGVDLFGNPAKWAAYRAGWASLPRLPGSFRGPVAGGWGSQEKVELMCSYRVAVCMESIAEPWYFSEKFVDAVRAGCVPVYHAHPTVAASVLRGATWVDPADFDFEPGPTLRHALDLSREDVAARNDAWLASDEVLATRLDRVLSRIADALREQDPARRR